jgi:hypothetical protein
VRSVAPPGPHRLFFDLGSVACSRARRNIGSYGPAHWAIRNQARSVSSEARAIQAPTDGGSPPGLCAHASRRVAVR